MRFFLVVFFVFFTNFYCHSQPEVRTNELLELSGIAWRLAGAEEYDANGNVIDSYAKDIDEYFAKHKTHSLIPFIRLLREKPHEVAYDGVATSTMLLQLVNGRIMVDPKADVERYLSEFDSRWNRPALEKYVFLLNDFYRKSRFHKFYVAHQTTYLHAKEKVDSLLMPLDTKWFESFYGKPFGNPDVYVCLSYGSNNYALHSTFMQILGETKYGIIIGCNSADKFGMPDFNISDFGTILHEFSHNFSNPVVEKYIGSMADAGNKIFPHVKARLAKIGYGSAETMLGEGLNELFRMMYYVEKYKVSPIYDIRVDENGGFIWMQRAVRFMDNFYACREIYPTIEDFMPELAEFMNCTAENLETISFEFEHRHPYVVNVFPLQKSDVPVSLPAIRIQFSHPMLREITGMSECDNPDYTSLPIKRMYWSDTTTYVIELGERLESDTSYAIVVPNYVCVSSQSGQSLQKDVLITFRTAKQ